jgi:hypothetical protein
MSPNRVLNAKLRDKVQKNLSQEDLSIMI